MTIAVYGGSGRLGRLVTDRLIARGAPVVVGGRDRAKLDHAAAERDVTTRVAAIDDGGALRAFLDGCGVVVNCAGPSHVCGAPLITAALDSDTPLRRRGGGPGVPAHCL